MTRHRCSGKLGARAKIVRGRTRSLRIPGDNVTCGLVHLVNAAHAQLKDPRMCWQINALRLGLNIGERQRGISG
jgi:hypothetical protein